MPRSRPSFATRSASRWAAGKSEDEIRDYLVARYGDFVLLRPPFKASTLLLWIGPFVLVAIGVGCMLLQRRRSATVTPGGAGLAPPELSESERARVKRLLGEGPDEPRGHDDLALAHPRRDDPGGGADPRLAAIRFAPLQE